VDDAHALVAAAGRIVVLTGAGISTDSGIPDFRGPQGVWTKDPAAQRSSDIRHYVADPEVRRQVWRTRMASPAWTAQPNPGHLAIVDLERQSPSGSRSGEHSRLHTLVTQNIDGLHQRAGSDPALVVELHGTMRQIQCLSCGERSAAETVYERVRAGDDDPSCLSCGGILKSATVSFGQQLVAADLERAWQAAAACNLLLAVGSSLTVSPANALVDVAAAAGAPVVIVNAEPTPYDDLAAAVVRRPISEVLPALVR